MHFSSFKPSNSKKAVVAIYSLRKSLHRSLNWMVFAVKIEYQIKDNERIHGIIVTMMESCHKSVGAMCTTLFISRFRAYADFQSLFFRVAKHIV